MGKKSKRSNRKGRSVTNMSMLSRRLAKLEKESDESYQNWLYSKASNKLREGLEAIQQVQDAMMLIHTGLIDSRVFEMKASFCQNLLMLEYSSCRFDKVIQIYNDIQMSPEIEKEMVLSFICKLYGRLAMLRLDASNENKDKLVSLIEDHISEGMTARNEKYFCLEAVRVLRNLKDYDASITLCEKLERLDQSEVVADFEIAVSHLERYREEYHWQKDNEFALVRVLDGWKEFFDKQKQNLAPRLGTIWMVFAQKDYLCHQIDDKELSSQFCRNAIENVEKYLEWKWHFERHCFTCNQADTHFVCSGCRLACYCSLDHQRMTWKKDAVQGMLIGHEILCPMMKAYRKWKLASKTGDQKALKLRRRLDRECLYFLSHGLGLEDKCFREEDVQKLLSS
ncbi:predicted protein [Chaetoceros tenuissimus]|uniref:MYND-type domain-containing protein n=1 Tax=Chaetoceros tenuissimus TaxID=426638 RepID=A0AAD3GYG8_9STRA|nr:predicted protein [Chaetoceros tenuissimus]